MDTSALRLSIYFSLQSIFKHILTEGDRIVLTALVGAYDSGVYAMASSYGGMASRILFQPLEENGRLIFSHLHVSIVEEKSKAISMSKKQDTSTTKTKELVQRLEMTYCVMVKCVLYIGLIFAVFGSNYTSILLKILAGNRWGSNPDAASTLSIFCIYLSIMSLNGMTEAFVYGVAESGKEVAILSVAHFVVGIVFYILAPLLVQYGDTYGVGGTIGLILSNGTCMVLRTMYSFLFATNYFRRYQDAYVKKGTLGVVPFIQSSLGLFVKILPRTPVMFSLMLSFITLRRSKNRLLLLEENGDDGGFSTFSTEILYHLGLGIVLFVLTTLSILVYELEYLGNVRDLFMSKKQKEKMN